MATPSPKTPFSLAIRALERGTIVAAIALVACTPVPLLSRMARTARQDFSEAHFCPAYRVGSRVADATPQAPERIARDPERLAMWRAAAARRAPERRLVHVRGCEENATYACWDEGGSASMRHHPHEQRWVSFGTVCLDQSGEH
jgi:hypothetical protein